MSSSAVPPSEPPDQPDEEGQQKRRERFPILARAYNEGYNQGGVEDGCRRLREKLDEQSSRPCAEGEQLFHHFARRP